MLRKLVILGLSISLAASVFGGIAKISRHFDSWPAKAHELANQVAALEKDLEEVEAKAGKQPAIRARIQEVRVDANRLLERNSNELRWNWWEEGLPPIILCAFLWLLIRNKNLLTQQVGSSNGG